MMLLFDNVPFVGAGSVRGWMCFLGLRTSGSIYGAHVPGSGAIAKEVPVRDDATAASNLRPRPWLTPSIERPAAMEWSAELLRHRLSSTSSRCKHFGVLQSGAVSGDRGKCGRIECLRDTMMERTSYGP